jgi:hypothetical protein
MTPTFPGIASAKMRTQLFPPQTQGETDARTACDTFESLGARDPVEQMLALHIVGGHYAALICQPRRRSPCTVKNRPPPRTSRRPRASKHYPPEVDIHTDWKEALRQGIAVVRAEDAAKALAP